MKAMFFTVPLKVYPFDVMVSMGEEDETLRRKLIRRGIPECEIDEFGMKTPDNFDLEQGRCTMFKGNEVLLRVYKYPEKPEHFGHLQHEIFHAAAFVLMKVGLKLCYKSDEAYAYLIDYLTTEIYKRIWNR